MSKDLNFDIQGLRALAVLAVVIYHINPSILPGGYLGVDIFFVISGYLIIGHIWNQLENKNFYLINFYLKRVKRLFPALFVMILGSIIIGYFILLPSETTSLHKSIISSLFYVSNFYFYSVTDYFNTSIHYAPMLHTWSLSVEEQFYIFFPLLLIFLHKYKKKILLLLFGLFIIFFILSLILVNIDQSFAFYSSPSRFFQFLAGGLLSISKLSNNLNKIKNELLSLIGLIIISICFFLYNDTTTFPGINALLPTLATLLIIFSSEKSKYVHLLFTNKISILIGNASYSIYLWHWPLIVYWKLNTGALTKIEQLLILILSIIIGLISWHFIENKTRYMKFKNSPILLSIGLSSVIAVIMIITMDGMKYRYDTNQLKIADYLNYSELDYREGTCFFTDKNNDIKLFDKKTCIKFDEKKQNILLIGDSHAAMFYTTLSHNISGNQTLSQITASGCRPLLNAKGKERCTNLIKYAYDDILKNYTFDTIIISARWQKDEITAINETLNYLKNYSKNILFIGTGIDFETSLPRILISNKKDFITKNDLYKYNEVLEIDSSIQKLIEDKSENIKYISTFTPFCNQDGCKLTINDLPIIYDTNHLTLDASNYIYKQQIDTLIKR
jgi:peptidoglycan/LPS O-acetylase OafA/YrhL